MGTSYEHLLSKYGSVPRVWAGLCRGPVDPIDRTADREALFHIERVSSVHPSRFEKSLLKAQIDLAELTERYEALSEQLDVALEESDRPPLTARLLRLLGRRREAQRVAWRKRAQRAAAIMTLVDEMADILGLEHEQALLAKESASALRYAAAEEMSRIDREILRRIRAHLTERCDTAGDEEEVSRLQKELEEIRETIDQTAAALDGRMLRDEEANIEGLAEELSHLLDLKEAVLTGQVAAGGAVTELRRRFLEATPGLDALRAAAAVARSSYEAQTTLLDTMTQLEARYRHALAHLLPLFRIESDLSSASTSAGARARLLDLNRRARRLLDDNERLATHVAREALELMIDPAKAPAVARDIRVCRTELGDLRTRWAEERTRLSPGRPLPS